MGMAAGLSEGIQGVLEGVLMKRFDRNYWLSLGGLLLVFALFFALFGWFISELPAALDDLFRSAGEAWRGE